MALEKDNGTSDSVVPDAVNRPMRPDAQRSIDALLEAAKSVFATSGVDAPVRAIADQAGVGMGTLYRHFPQRSDLVAAVFRREIDACADAAASLAVGYAPFEALAQWVDRFAAFIATKRGLAIALHSENPAFQSLPVYFDQRLRPAFAKLLQAAVDVGAVRNDVDADDILGAIGSLCMASKIDRPDHAQRMVALFVDGLRYGAQHPVKPPEIGDKE